MRPTAGVCARVFMVEICFELQELGQFAIDY
jgi:hypothetical protein